ncbi:hypothetical protein HK096_001600 [Nowakowskiella sp. JEL0078]|nr:hypothetical protein HK096_001600 [Nowakowskiella sp. JEL0078]
MLKLHINNGAILSSLSVLSDLAKFKIVIPHRNVFHQIMTKIISDDDDELFDKFVESVNKLFVSSDDSISVLLDSYFLTELIRVCNDKKKISFSLLFLKYMKDNALYRSPTIYKELFNFINSSVLDHMAPNQSFSLEMISNSTLLTKEGDLWELFVDAKRNGYNASIQDLSIIAEVARRSNAWEHSYIAAEQISMIKGSWTNWSPKPDCWETYKGGIGGSLKFTPFGLLKTLIMSKQFEIAENVYMEFSKIFNNSSDNRMPEDFFDDKLTGDEFVQLFVCGMLEELRFDPAHKIIADFRKTNFISRNLFQTLFQKMDKYPTHEQDKAISENCPVENISNLKRTVSSRLYGLYVCIFRWYSTFTFRQNDEFRGDFDVSKCFSLVEIRLNLLQKIEEWISKSGLPSKANSNIRSIQIICPQHLYNSKTSAAVELSSLLKKFKPPLVRSSTANEIVKVETSDFFDWILKVSAASKESTSLGNPNFKPLLCMPELLDKDVDGGTFNSALDVTPTLMDTNEKKIKEYTEQSANSHSEKSLEDQNDSPSQPYKNGKKSQNSFSEPRSRDYQDNLHQNQRREDWKSTNMAHKRYRKNLDDNPKPQGYDHHSINPYELRGRDDTRNQRKPYPYEGRERDTRGFSDPRRDMTDVNHRRLSVSPPKK